MISPIDQHHPYLAEQHPSNILAANSSLESTFQFCSQPPTIHDLHLCCNREIYWRLGSNCWRTEPDTQWLQRRPTLPPSPPQTDCGWTGTFHPWNWKIHLSWLILFMNPTIIFALEKLSTTICINAIKHWECWTGSSFFACCRYQLVKTSFII